MTHVSRGSGPKHGNIMLRSQPRDTRPIMDLASLLHIKTHLPKYT